MLKLLEEYYRCAGPLPNLRLTGKLSDTPGFFSALGVTCYGRQAEDSKGGEAFADGKREPSGLSLPFDPDEVVENCRFERYRDRGIAGIQNRGFARTVYYGVRPLLPLSVRKHLQRYALRGWEHKAFPKWPVDTTVDSLLRRVLGHLLEKSGMEKIPFIWFWPEGNSSCLIMTHDVETGAGRDFCEALMDLNDSFGIKSSFQVVPEKRYEVPEDYLQSIRGRGFEVNLHGLSHDGLLFDNYAEFKRRAALINAHGRRFGAVGFRSPVLYRNPDWMHQLEFEYDMSFPNVAHLDPQQGGCATVMPYFIHHLVELPLTCTQDYTLFHMLRDLSIDLWQKQIEIIRSQHGLISFIVHPDYVVEQRYRRVYEALLGHLAGMIERKEAVCMLPRDANGWWRQRSQMRLARSEAGWQIEGPGSERARIAWACLRDGAIAYEMEQTSASPGQSTGALGNSGTTSGL